MLRYSTLHKAKLFSNHILWLTQDVIAEKFGYRDLDNCQVNRL